MAACAAVLCGYVGCLSCTLHAVLKYSLYFVYIMWCVVCLTSLWLSFNCLCNYRSVTHSRTQWYDELQQRETLSLRLAINLRGDFIIRAYIIIRACRSISGTDVRCVMRP